MSNHVIILGAGFSFDTGIALLGEFVEKMWELAAQKARAAVRPSARYTVRSSVNTLFICFGLVVFLSISPPVYAEEPIVANLGVKSGVFGTTKQAGALEQLIKNNPGKNAYKVIYTTNEDIVVFECDLKKEVLVRLRSTSNGSHGTEETWVSDILFRINSAARGGSLNDTSQGKKYSTTQSF